jgi:hypothetical protein
MAIRQVECNRYQRGVYNWDKPVSFSCIAIAPTLTLNQRWCRLSHSAAEQPHERRFQSLAIENKGHMAVKNRKGNAGIYDPIIDYLLPIESKARN